MLSMQLYSDIPLFQLFVNKFGPHIEFMVYLKEGIGHRIVSCFNRTDWIQMVYYSTTSHSRLCKNDVSHAPVYGCCPSLTLTPEAATFAPQRGLN
jgi:hypothetical protein